MEKSVWKGYDRVDFTLEDRAGLIVAPHAAAPGRPWIWRAEFFDAYAQADMAMLEKGWHLAYYRVSDLYGCPQAIRLMRGFQTFVVKRFELAGKTVLFGFSRGGLYSLNYAAAYPEKVAALYLDAPVVDVRSWPGGFGKAKRSEAEWRECKRLYGIADETTGSFGGNPIDQIDRVADARIPILVVYGDKDTTAVFSENAERLIERYHKRGAEIRVIVKPGAGHHPHSLEDPAPIVDFLLKCGIA